MTSTTPIRVLAASALVAASAGLALPAQAATGDASVSILHAVPGATVDVYANGNALLTNFTPGTLTDPVMLAPGSYDLKVVAAGAGASGTAVTEAKGVTVPANANITVVAHLTADGAPVLTPYVNDTSAVPAGQARLTVRHDAAAPAVDVRANGTAALKGLTNPKEATAVVAAGTIKADVVLAGTSTVAIGPTDLPLKEGANTIVYAWGSRQQPQAGRADDQRDALGPRRRQRRHRWPGRGRVRPHPGSAHRWRSRRGRRSRAPAPPPPHRERPALS